MVEATQSVRMHSWRVPRYYFHLFNEETVMDEQGMELPDPAAAREQAIDDARDMICRSVREGRLNLDHRMEVTDESGGIVVTVRFRDAFTIEG
jgi:hypothetical protein